MSPPSMVITTAATAKIAAKVVHRSRVGGTKTPRNIVSQHSTTKLFTPCTTKLPSTTLVGFLFQHKLAVISMCWLCTMCWLAVHVASFTFAVLRKGGFAGYRL